MIFSSLGANLITKEVSDNFTSEANTIYLVNTNSGNIVTNLPSNPLDGDTLIYADAKGSILASARSGFSLASLTINSSRKIQDDNTLVINFDNLGVTILFSATEDRWFIIGTSL